MLALLSLGIKGIYLGPTLPAFLSPNVLQYLVDTFDLRLITNAEDDITQEQLAEKLNVSGTYIVKIESNQRTGSVEFAVELAHCFGVSLDYLLLGTACNDKRQMLKTVIAFHSELEESFEI